MKIFGLLVLCLHVSSSICETMDAENCSFGNDFKKDSKRKRYDDANDTRYVTVSQISISFKKLNNCSVPKRKNENKDKVKEHINDAVRRGANDLDKTDAEINNFLNEYFPTYYHTYSFSTKDELRVKVRLDSIEKSLKDAVATRNQTKLKESYSEYIHVLANCGRIASLYTQITECMELLAQVNDSNHTFSSTINLFDEVMIMAEIGTDFTLVAAKRIAFLSLIGHFKHMIGEQKTVFEQFPQKLDKFNKLAEIQHAFRHTIDTLYVIEGVIQLDSSIQFGTATFGGMKDTTALNPSIKLHNKLVNLKKKLHEKLYFKVLNSINYNIDSQPGRLNDPEAGRGLMLKAIRTSGPAIVSKFCSKNALLSGAMFYDCGYALRRSGRYEEANAIFERAAINGLFQSFWKRSTYFMNGLIARPIWNIDQTGIAPLLYQVQTQWKNIREEALWIFERKLFKPQGEGITKRGEWGVYNLYDEGIRIKENCLNAPLTCSLVEKIPQISKTIRGRVKFSIMEAGTHIASHAGPTNSRVRIHLGLKVPPVPINVTSTANSPCKARIVNEYFTWEDGEINIFDDSFEHEVWQFDPLKRPRLILIMDMAHPELTDHQLILL